MAKFKAFLKRKDVEVSLKRYGIDALGAMAQGLFCTLLVGTILDTLGTQLGIGFLASPIVEINDVGYTIGKFASAMVGPAMAVAIGYALQYPAQVELLVPVDAWGISPVLPFPRFSYWYIHKTNMTLSQYKWIAKSRLLAKWFIGYSLIGDKHKITDAMVEEVLRACKEDNALYKGLNVVEGKVTYKAVADVWGLDYSAAVVD